MTIFYLPDLGEGLAEATIREWYIQMGEEVQIDQPLLSVETEKALVDIPSPYHAKIKEIHGKNGEVIKTGAPLITFKIIHSDDSNIPEKSKSSVSIVGKLKENQTWLENKEIDNTEKKEIMNIKILPRARQLAKELNININNIQGSGAEGCITVSDVKNFSQKNNSETNQEKNAASISQHTRSMMRVMRQSQQDVIPATLFDDADISHFNEQTDITIQLIIAIIAALKIEPSFNAWFDEKAKQMKLFSEINLGIAVDTPHGLYVPVIHGAQHKNSQALRQEINAFKTMAEQAAFPKEILQDATFILSNFGKFSGKYATPIIMSTMVGILAAERIYQGLSEQTKELKRANYLPLSLTFDHRIITGGMAARFLGEIKNRLESV